MELVKGVHAIGPSSRGLSQGGYSRAYVFEDEDGLTLVDTLWDEDAHLILQYLWSIGRTPADIAHIAMTHAHRSHLGGLATMRALSGATVHCHAAEAPIIEGRRPAAKISLWPPLPVELVPFRVASQLGLQPHVPCEVDRKDLVEGSTVGSLKVLHLPGHTPGNLAFSWDDDRVLAVAISSEARTTRSRFSKHIPAAGTARSLSTRSTHGAGPSSKTMGRPRTTPCGPCRTVGRDAARVTTTARPSRTTPETPCRCGSRLGAPACSFSRTRTSPAGEQP